MSQRVPSDSRPDHAQFVNAGQVGKVAADNLAVFIKAGLPADFMTHEFAMEEIDAALAVVRSGKAIKVLLRY